MGDDDGAAAGGYAINLSLASVLFGGRPTNVKEQPGRLWEGRKDFIIKAISGQIAYHLDRLPSFGGSRPYGAIHLSETIDDATASRHLLLRTTQCVKGRAGDRLCGSL